MIQGLKEALNFPKERLLLEFCLAQKLRLNISQ